MKAVLDQHHSFYWHHVNTETLWSGLSQRLQKHPARRVVLPRDPAVVGWGKLKREKQRKRWNTGQKLEQKVKKRIKVGRMKAKLWEDIISSESQKPCKEYQLQTIHIWPLLWLCHKSGDLGKKREGSLCFVSLERKSSALKLSKNFKMLEIWSIKVSYFKRHPDHRHQQLRRWYSELWMFPPLIFLKWAKKKKQKPNQKKNNHKTKNNPQLTRNSSPHCTSPHSKGEKQSSWYRQKALHGPLAVFGRKHPLDCLLSDRILCPLKNIFCSLMLEIHLTI